ncbi:arylsulfatase [Membranihabitans maritimus]|uniref:arylsulfatase n=1 Tax=Membranihabitans maritimus TaxID=2904244 RepID=UPI001F216FE6|nr:arylsulfatase [Membranihabitans maritimus]
MMISPLKEMCFWQYCSLFLGAINIISCQSSSKEEGMIPPNVIVILSDDQGWGDLSITGNTTLQTPNIDRIGKEGALLSRFYVSPVCSPTRAEFLTGRYHTRMGVYSTSAGGEMMDLDEKTIAQVFQEAGYATAAFGKWHNGMQFPYHPNARGFEEYYGFCSGHWGDYFSPPLDHNGELVKGNGYLTNDFTDHALDFMADNKDQPFFMYVAYNTPHAPMQVPDRWWKDMVSRNLNQYTDDRFEEDTLFTKAALAMCENIDWNVGRILDQLDESKLAENTIILYFSDNGPNSYRYNAGFKGRKGSIDEGGVRSPFLIRYPGNIPEGIEVSALSGAIDLLPTLADFSGIEVSTEKKLDGVSLKSVLTNSASPEDRYLYSYWKGKAGVRTQKYLYTHQDELYDIEEDPGQRNNITEDDALKGEMEGLLTAWVNKVESEQNIEERPFPLGHPAAEITQMPARDGIAHGGIQRSNKYPNCSFFTNWKKLEDRVTWDVNVWESGIFEVELYYTCPSEDTGATVQLSIGEQSLKYQVEEAHDPPLRGMENDRVQRPESYVKDFKKVSMGTIQLDGGRGVLELKAMDIPGESVMDFRLLVFRKI